MRDEVIKQIDDILGKHTHDQGDEVYTGETNSRLKSAIGRLAPHTTTYKADADKIIAQFGVTNSYCIAYLIGILRALRQDYKDGYLSNIEGLIRGDLFSDFLDMARHLLSENYKDPAAVMIGGVLEEHLRKLCGKVSIDIFDKNGAPQKANWLNTELYKAQAISGLDHKNVTSWLDIRNKAAHGKYGEYTQEQVSLVLQGVQDFLSRMPA